MGYEYQRERPRVFTEDGSTMLLKIRDNAKSLIASAGAARSDRLMSNVSGDSWQMLACIDRLVEIGDLLEIPNPTSGAGQHRIFTKYDGGA